VFRFAVIWYLILATVAGPAAFCCCKTKGLVTSLHTTLGPAQTPTQAVSAPSPRSCCHADTTPAPDAPRVPGKAPDNTPHRQCPCPQKEGNPALLAAEQDFSRTLALSVVPAPLALDGDSPFFISLELPQTRLTSDGSGLPFLSAQDLLRAHHQLRC
jgi:hypothetical protein